VDVKDDTSDGEYGVKSNKTHYVDLKDDTPDGQYEVLKVDKDVNIKVDANVSNCSFIEEHC
jgi:hypothetical protein